MADQRFQGPVNNRTCQVCWANDASHFCNCQGQPTLFCIACFTPHYTKDSRAIHKAIPIAVLGKDPKEYKRKNKALKEAVAALRRNLELVDQCCHEFDEMMKASIDYFTAFRNWWLQYMQAQKDTLSTAIEAAVLETANCLDQGEVPVSTLGLALWTLPPDELQVVRYSIALPDLQTLLQTCSYYRNDMETLSERFSLPRVEEVKSNAAQKLSEIGIKHALPAEVVNEWLMLLNTLRDADQLDPLLQKIISLPTQMVVGSVQATLELCTRRPETMGELSRGLEVLLDKPEAVFLLTNLSLLSDSALVATILDAVCLQPEILATCTELSNLLGFFQRDSVPPPNFLPSLQYKSKELTILAQVCSNLLYNPDNHMTTLSAQLVEALASPAPVELLVFIATLAIDLLHQVSPERVEELGLLLLAASADAIQLQILKDLQAGTDLLRYKLLSLLNSSEKLTIETLRRLLHFSQAEDSKMPQQRAIQIPAIHPKHTPLQTPTKMVGIWRNTAFSYEIQSQQFSEHTLSVNFGVGGSCIQADRNTLLCVGANPASSAVYLLTLSTFQLSPLPSLFTPRDSAGLAKVNAHFYVLGGYNGGGVLSSCEKMKLADKCWTRMSRMTHPRVAFTPCHYGSLLYIVSSNQEANRTVETFNAETETFTLFPVSLPQELRFTMSVAFIAYGELCILTDEKQIALWNIDTEREFRLFNTDRWSWSCQQPLIVGSFVLIAYKGEVQKFSLETYSFLD